MIEALRGAPGLHGIIDHISKPDMTRPLDAEWCAAIEVLAGMPNIVPHFIGLADRGGRGPGPWKGSGRSCVEFVANAFGPKRLFFGSDWPVCRLAASAHAQVVELAKDILGQIYGPEDMQAIMETNGKAFYRLTDEGAR